MRQWIKIVESLDSSPVDWEWTSYGERKTAEFTVNGKHYGLILARDGQIIFYLKVLDDDGQELYAEYITKTGDALIVFSTVISIIENYINRDNPASLYFESDAKSRSRLYMALCQRLHKKYPQYEFNYWKSEYSNTTHFEFSKPEADY